MRGAKCVVGIAVAAIVAALARLLVSARRVAEIDARRESELDGWAGTGSDAAAAPKREISTPR